MKNALLERANAALAEDNRRASARIFSREWRGRPWRPDSSRIRCDRCRITMTARTMVDHLTHRHRIRKCSSCRQPIRRFDWTFVGTGNHFCSKRCQDRIVRRHLCRECLKQKVEPFYTGDVVPMKNDHLCAPCARRLGLRGVNA